MAMNYLHSKLHAVGEYVTPVLKNSKFHETGVLTPEEFIASGDFLCYKCPTWRWESGESSKKRSFLPPDKQYLVTRNVPCFKRIKTLEYNEGDETTVEADDDDEDGWVETHTGASAAADDGDMDDIAATMKTTTLAEESLQSLTTKGGVDAAEDSDSDDDDIPDMDDFQEENLAEEDPAALAPAAASGSDNILKTRSYDLYVTYDKYYQTPRLWLTGYDENRKPLDVTLMYEDISQDHAKKTVTLEAHPHLSQNMASIHPCKHSTVMKKLVSMFLQGGQEPKVHLYIMIFLKFVQSVIPTIEYDFTRDITF